jgi:hypothetical protein
MKYVIFLILSTIFHFKKFEEKRNFLLQALARIRIGYKFGLRSNPWKADGNVVLNSPFERIGSFNIEILAGF